MTERFNTFNYELERHLQQDFPKSLLDAIITTAETFDIDLDEVMDLLGDNYKQDLAKEYHIDLSEGFPTGLF